MRADKKALILLMSAYAVYSPFWLTVLLIDLELIKRWLGLGYFNNCGVCSLPLFAGSLFLVVKMAYQTKQLVLQNPTAREFTEEVGSKATLLLALTFVLVPAFFVITYQFLD